jgi:hypothetical protein
MFTNSLRRFRFKVCPSIDGREKSFEDSERFTVPVVKRFGVTMIAVY